ncbi:MAG: hypothetical protein C0485_11425 [Pirellula sp.]|nr:hypothetical protein [Pirellula sp.]
MALVVAAAFVPAVAAATPWAFYNPANGNIHIMNDTGAPLANASILSASGRLTNASFMADLPGATKEGSEFPFAYTYLKFSTGLHNAGKTVQPGVPTSDLRFEYRTASLFDPLIQGFFGIPEPSSCTLAALSALALTGTVRRCARRHKR